MDNFDSYNVLLVIATLIYYCATYDCFCAPGSYICQYWEYLTKSSYYYYYFLSSMTVNSNAFQYIFTSKVNQNEIKLISIDPSLIQTNIGTEIKINK